MARPVPSQLMQPMALAPLHVWQAQEAPSALSCRPGVVTHAAHVSLPAPSQYAHRSRCFMWNRCVSYVISVPTTPNAPPAKPATASTPKRPSSSSAPKAVTSYSTRGILLRSGALAAHFDCGGVNAHAAASSSSDTAPQRRIGPGRET